MSKKGRPPVQRSPREKKSLSYDKDRRNSYGENDKASRKAIPLRRAQENRDVRRKTAQSLSQIGHLDDEAADLAESSARQDIGRTWGWRKAADMPLGEIVANQLQLRTASFGAKTVRRQRQLAFQEYLKELKDKS